MNLDHLTSLPDTLTGFVVSVKDIPSGFSFVIKPDDPLADRRFIGHSAELIPPATQVKPGYQVSFLPGSPTKRGRQPRAYRIGVLQRDNPQC